MSRRAPPPPTPRQKLYRAIRAFERAARLAEWAGSKDAEEACDIRAKFNRKSALLDIAIRDFEKTITADARRQFFHDVLGISGLGFDEQAASLYKHENTAINEGKSPLLAFFLAARKFAGWPINTLLTTMREPARMPSFQMQTPETRDWLRSVAAIVSCAPGGKIRVHPSALQQANNLELVQTQMPDGTTEWSVR